MTGSVARPKAERRQCKNKNSKRDAIDAEESPTPALEPAGQQAWRQPFNLSMGGQHSFLPTPLPRPET